MVTVNNWLLVFHLHDYMENEEVGETYKKNVVYTLNGW